MTAETTEWRCPDTGRLCTPEDCDRVCFQAPAEAHGDDRAAFEAYCTAKHDFPKKWSDKAKDWVYERAPDGGYYQFTMHACWLAWQAGQARAARLAPNVQPKLMASDVWEIGKQVWPSGGPTLIEQSKFADLIERKLERIAALSPAPAQSAAYLTGDGKLHVTAWECHGCGHRGIDDGDDAAEACSDCNWRGPCPDEDVCPGCGREGTMVSACPKCGDRYYIKAEADIVIPAAAQAPAPAHAVPAGWKLAAFPVDWTPGGDWFKAWAASWFGPDADDQYLRRAVQELLANAPTAPYPAVGAEPVRYPHPDEDDPVTLWKEIRRLRAAMSQAKCDCTAYCGQYVLHGSCRAHPAPVTISHVPVQGSGQ